MSRFASICVGLVLAIAGCAPAASGNEESLCTVVCRCQAGGLPSQQRACVDACVEDADLGAVTDACVACIFVNADSCTTLFETCDSACDRDDEPEPGQPDAAFIPDAF